MESTKSGGVRVVAKSAKGKGKRPAPRNQVKAHIFGDLSCTLKRCGYWVLLLACRVKNRNHVRRGKVPTFKRRVNVVLLVHRFVKALLPTKPPAKLDAPPVYVALVDNILHELPKSTRSAMAALPTTLVEGGLDTEALVIDMNYALVHDDSVLHKSKNEKWIVTSLDAIQQR